MGGFVLTLRFEAQEDRDQELLQALAGQVMPELTGRPRIAGAHLVRNDASLTGGNAGNQRGRVILLPDIVVLIEGSSAEGVRAAGEALLSDARLVQLGAKPEIVRGLYQLEYSIQNLA